MNSPPEIMDKTPRTNRVFLRTATTPVEWSIVPQCRSNQSRVISNLAFTSERPSASGDLYLPDPALGAHLPAVLLIHGGGWRLGDKADERNILAAEWLNSAGLAVLSINYTLHQEGDPEKAVPSRIAWPDNVNDCLAAFDWLRGREAADLGIQTESISLLGFSAGGHLALHVAARRRGQARCVVNAYGPGRVPDRFRAAFVDPLRPETGVHFQQASIAGNLDASFPPTLILHGSADLLIPVEESRWLVSEIKKSGGSARLIELEGAPHGFRIPECECAIQIATLEFLDRHAKSRSS